MISRFGRKFMKIDISVIDFSNVVVVGCILMIPTLSMIMLEAIGTRIRINNGLELEISKFRVHLWLSLSLIDG